MKEKLNFIYWLENEEQGMGLRGLFRSTCGNKSCSRGSGRGWDPYSNDNTGKAKLINVPVVIDNKSKSYFNLDRNTLVLIDTEELYNNTNKNLIKEFIQKIQSSVLINKSQILNFINKYNKENKNENQFTDLQYLRQFRAKNSVAVEFKLV